MAIAFVASAAGVDTAGPINTTGANLIVLSTGWYSEGGSRFPIISDSKGNTWTPLTLRASGFGTATQMFYCVNPTVGSGHTFTNAQTFGVVYAAAFSGVAASPLDLESDSASSNVSSLGISLSPSEDGCLVVTGASAFNDAAGWGIDAGFTAIGTDAGGANVGAAGAYLIQSTASPVSPTWSWTGSASAGVAATIASFKPTGGGAVSNPWYYYQQEHAAAG